MTSVDQVGVFTPYSTAQQLMGENIEAWAPELDQERVSSYLLYDRMYWNDKDVFKLLQRGDEEEPLYVPVPQTIVDNTAHFWMKGLTFKAPEAFHTTLLDPFLKREAFLAKFNVAKHSGVCRGDFILHLTADPSKPGGSRVSVNSVDPAAYFPEFDDDDLDRVIAVNLVEQQIDALDPSKTRMRVQRYEYGGLDGSRRVFTSEILYEVRDWWHPKKRKVVTVVRARKPLPAKITTIPVYHFKNMDWQGDPFGSSDLRGYERILAGINQSAGDEELALALDGLGVYATDSGRPVDADGKEIDWVVAPGHVIQLSGTFFKRVEGLQNVEPFQAHLKYLHDSLYESAAMFRGHVLDATVAESGIALAIKFLPTAAKLEQRDLAATAKLEQFWFDWKFWIAEYDNVNVADVDIEIILGDKLPENKVDRLNVLNNMADRKAISVKFYREEVARLYGIIIPDDMDEQIQQEANEAFEAAQKIAALTSPDQGNQSNNKNRPNESGGTEADSGGGA